MSSAIGIATSSYCNLYYYLFELFAARAIATINFLKCFAVRVIAIINSPWLFVARVIAIMMCLELLHGPRYCNHFSRVYLRPELFQPLFFSSFSRPELLQSLFVLSYSRPELLQSLFSQVIRVPCQMPPHPCGTCTGGRAKGPTGQREPWAEAHSGNMFFQDVFKDTPCFGFYIEFL